MTDAVGVITGFYFYLKNGAGWHADSITTGYLFVNVFFFACLGDWNEMYDLFSTKY